MIILKETCLGEFYFTVAVILRESLLFSSMLLSSEVWFNITKQEIEQLVRVDKALLRKYLGGLSSKSVGCGMFLELGIWPINIVLIGKRVMFLHYILSRPETDLLYRVFQAQDKQPVKNDWALQIKKDLTDLGLELSHTEIKLKSKEAFKKIVMDKCNNLAFAHLMKEAESKSKMKSLKYKKLEMQKYFKTDRLNTTQKNSSF